ncbi:MAG: hypothetical protein R3C24_07115 [Cyanobacteriota/Melainabacteria group bacterium]
MKLARKMDSSKRVVLMLNNLAPYLKSEAGSRRTYGAYQCGSPKEYPGGGSSGF